MSSVRAFNSLSSIVSDCRDPQELGNLAGKIENCLHAVIQQAINLCRKLKDTKEKSTFLQEFRTGLLNSGRARPSVDKTMTLMNQCCLKGLTFHCLDPAANKAAQLPNISDPIGGGSDQKLSSGDDADDEDDEPPVKSAAGAAEKDNPGALKITGKRARRKQKLRPRKKIIIVSQKEINAALESDDDAAALPAVGMSSFQSTESLLALKSMRTSCVTLHFIDRLFELFHSGSIKWDHGKNICVDLLLHIGGCHDKVLSWNGRQPCGSVVQQFKEAIPHWHQYEKQQSWNVSDKDGHLQSFEADMNSEQRWAISNPSMQGAVGLVLWGIIAYFPSLCFTNISHHEKETNHEIRNNRAMAMLPSHYSIAMFSLLEMLGYITKDGYPEEFWETSAVCLSSNDSAMDIQRVEKTFKEQHFRVFSDEDKDCFHFEDPPPLWGLNPTQSWVKVSSVMWAEIGPRR